MTFTDLLWYVIASLFCLFPAAITNMIVIDNILLLSYLELITQFQKHRDRFRKHVRLDFSYNFFISNLSAFLRFPWTDNMWLFITILKVKLVPSLNVIYDRFSHTNPRPQLIIVDTERYNNPDIYLSRIIKRYTHHVFQVVK